MLGTLRQNLRYAVRALWEEPAEEIPAKPAGNLRRNPRRSWRGGCQFPFLDSNGLGKVPGAKPATQGSGICEENLLPTRLDSNGTLAPAVLVRPKCSIRPGGPSSSGDTGKSFSKRRSR